MKNIRIFRKLYEDNSGFTLIEVLIALAIFSIGFLAVGLLQLDSAKGNRRAQSVTYSSEWALDRVETMLPQGMLSTTAYDSVATAAPAQDADGIDNNYNGTVDEAGETGPLSISWTVDEVDLKPSIGTDIYNYKIITVTVTKTLGGETRTISLQNRIPKIV
ncbi:prepilin-type N-terminal cleavage/methylation domain-containing protein [uncultured Desulfosarcina sp.]|uniref:prepilin-type N-terminal cleavage/methylation domain-containing protein n=1 Tax=uncultured Desulfosarcina sp. TaxID=218289 RepID=UPI0029C8E5DE|nr:prepilin-type N-terminal cleavage/methylation domain-containing protein [uncultured Desulfosarcina sp.]